MNWLRLYKGCEPSVCRENKLILVEHLFSGSYFVIALKTFFGSVVVLEQVDPARNYFEESFFCMNINI